MSIDEDDPYDAVPYTDHAYAEAHPDRMAVVARLSGWRPPEVATARVLDVGCGRGGHALPLASSLPDASVVGVDASRVQIDEARSLAREAGITNATFHAARFEDVELGDASFDYVVCHGVWSWIPVDARRALLQRIARWLAPGGVAYVSFDTLPGGYERAAARDFLRFVDAHRDWFGSRVGQGSAALAWLRDRVSPEEPAYRTSLEHVRARLAETSRAYLVHDHLSSEHHAELVTTFLDEASQAGLAYLGDAIASETSVELLEDAARLQVESLDVVRGEQLVDFVKNTAFRRALLVREDERASRGWTRRWAMDACALDELRVASRLRPARNASHDGGGAELFSGGGASVQVMGAGARAALRELASLAPQSIAFAELASRAGAVSADARAQLRDELYDLWLATGALDLHAFEPRFVTTPSLRPRALPVARARARGARAGAITNAWLHEVVFEEDVVRDVLALLDGTRTIDDVARDIASARAVSVADATATARASVALLADRALLLA